jgi:hypothetical protein
VAEMIDYAGRTDEAFGLAAQMIDYAGRTDEAFGLAARCYAVACTLEWRSRGGAYPRAARPTRRTLASSSRSASRYRRNSISTRLLINAAR